MYKRILIVDDEVFVRELLAELLAQAGYEVHTAANQLDTIRLLESIEFHAALVDLRIPGVTGPELLHLIRRLNSDVSILVMTGHPTVDTAIEALRLGARDYIVKPFRLKEVERTVLDAVQEYHNRQHLRQLKERVVELEARLANLNQREKRGKLAVLRATESIGKLPELCDQSEDDSDSGLPAEPTLTTKNRLRSAERRTLLSSSS